jgi:glyoxylase-like metal-dependent hydrolase (beta-lactamase superfamily II)
MPVETLGELVAFGSDAYAVRYGNYVSVFFATPEGVILVNPSGQATPRMPQLIKAAIGVVTDQPVKYVIYSHWGSDHGRGGGIFADTAGFVAHRNVVAKVTAAEDSASPVPGLIVDRETTLALGGTGVQLYPTEFWDGDDYLIVYEPRSKVVLTIDFVQSRTVPFHKLFGTPNRVVQRLQWLDETLDFETVISGHPPITATRTDVREQRQYYLDLSDAVARANGDPAAVRALLAPRYSGWRRFDQMIDDNIGGFVEWSARTEE